MILYSFKTEHFTKAPFLTHASFKTMTTVNQVWNNSAQFDWRNRLSVILADPFTSI